MPPTSASGAMPWIVRLSPKNSAPMMAAATGSTTVSMGNDAASDPAWNALDESMRLATPAATRA